MDKVSAKIKEYNKYVILNKSRNLSLLVFQPHHG